MFRCNDCGAVFEYPAEWEEYRGECFGFPAYEKMYGCPDCESADYEYFDEDEEEQEEEKDEYDDERG